MSATARQRRVEAVIALLERHVAAVDGAAPEIRRWLDGAIADPDGLDDDELDDVTTAALVYGQLGMIDATGVPALEREVARLGRERSAPATRGNVRRADARSEEARRLKTTGLSVPAIALRMLGPDVDSANGERTVRRWLARKP